MKPQDALGFEPDDLGSYVLQLYARNPRDVEFSTVLAGRGQLSDERLADLIDTDGRTRIGRGLSVRLQRYLAAVPDLLSRPDALDAAIDVTLRSLSGSSRADAASVTALIEEYPELGTQIRDAAALSNALWSTTDLRQRMEDDIPRELPQDFGPPIETGEPRYELRRLLGAGAFGKVYLAVDRLLSEEDHPALVAIKVLNVRERSAWSRQRLIEEASKARRVDHPNVVRVLDRGVSSNDEDFITYELVDGGDLAQWLKQRKGMVEPREAARLAASIARGVQAAHSAGLVHCDLKPGNIMLTAHGEPKVADFGIAIRASRAGDSHVPQPHDDAGEGAVPGHPIGNLAYVAPEQYRCEEGSLTVPSDVYALGGILFTLLTGRLPNGSTLEEIAQTHDPNHGRKESPQLRSLRREIDRDLEAICRRAMAPKPERRYNSAGAFADDLESWLRCEPIAWTRPSGLRVARLWARRKPALAVVLALLMVSVVAAGVVVYRMERLRQAEEYRAVEAELARAAEERRAIEAELAHRAEEQRAIEAERAHEREQLRAELERVRAEEKEALNREAMETIAGGMARVRHTLGNRATTQFLSAIWIIEFVFETDVLGTPREPTELWKFRFEIVDQLVAQAEDEGRANDLETMLWRTTLAFWLVGAGDDAALDRAEPMLANLHDYWSGILKPEDRWIGSIESMQACAVVKRAQNRIRAQSGDQLDERVRPSLEEARTTLERYEPLFAADDAGSPLHFLLLETMVELYDLLDVPDARARMIAQRDHYAVPRSAARTPRQE